MITMNSCTPKVYFTQDIKNRLEQNKVDLKSIQFFNDRKVTLKRELKSGDAKVSSGKVKFENGRFINLIILKPYTPGIIEYKYPEYLTISFEFGLGKTIDFGKPKNGSMYGAYQILAEKWENNLGKINYDLQDFYIQPEGAGAKLMIKKSELTKINIDKRVIKGRRIN